MMNKRIIFTILFAILLSGVGGYFLYGKAKLDQDVRINAEYRKLYSAIQVFQKIWTEGELSGLESHLKGCPSSLKLSREKKKCSREILHCLSKNQEFKRKYVNLEIKRPLVSKASSELPINFSSALELELSYGGTSLVLHLEYGCHKAFLPHRIYTLEDSNSRKYSWWDNFGRNLFIDKTLVKNGDILDWLKVDSGLKGGDEILKIIVNSDESLPAVGLSQKEMVRYCAFRGEQLMDTVLFDAASMHPGDLNTNQMRFPLRSMWPWDYKKKIGTIYNYRNKKIKEVTLKECKQVFSRECLEIKKAIDREGAHTWTGIRSVLGGSLEHFRNPVYPKKNLKASSYLYNLDSPWHELGKRAWWDGTGFHIQNFNFRFADPPESVKNFDVAFRCYKEERS